MKFVDPLIDLVMRPRPLRSWIVRKLLLHWPIGSYHARLRAGAVDRAAYGWCTYYAAVQAKKLGYKMMTVVELGVAGGNGLTCLCGHRKEIQKELGIEIVLVGFDSGKGLPVSSDLRDLPYYWPAGSFVMNRRALEQRIAGRAELVLGDVSSTVAAWNPEPGAPLGAVMFDLDYYSSTTAALALLTKENVLPRIWCYFDDVCGSAEEAHTDNIGEREAINQFNGKSERGILNDHLSPAYVFRGFAPEYWHQHIYLYHRLSHPNYSSRLSGQEADGLQLTPESNALL
jgi:hypothetical protein